MSAAPAPRERGPEAGFSLVALFAAITIMLVLMAAAMPSWKYVVQNEREQELFFRGNEIAGAIERFQKKNGGAAPPSLEILVKGRFLRKAYKDPMTEDGKWHFIRVGEAMGDRRRRQMARQAAGMGAGKETGGPGQGEGLPGRPSTMGQGAQVGPFIGVSSLSKEKSLRIMNGAETYDEWYFVAGRPRMLGKQTQLPGPGMPGVGQPPAPQAGGGQRK